MLTAITIFTLAGGAVLGSRYKVLILAPAFLFVLVAVIGAGVARGADIWAIALEMLVATMALQLGYVGGSAFAVARRVRKPSRIRPNPTPVADPGRSGLAARARASAPSVRRYVAPHAKQRACAAR